MSTLPRFACTTLSRKERLAIRFRHWDALGRIAPPTADPPLLAGMFYSRFRSRMGGLLPYSRVEDDLRNFAALLRSTKDLAPWCIEAAFAIKALTGFRSDMFTSENFMAAFNIRSYAVKLRQRSIVGEQAEFFTDMTHYGVIRV